MNVSPESVGTRYNYKRAAWMVVTLIACAMLAELFYAALLTDIEYLSPWRQCRHNIVLFGEGADARCPLSGINDGYILFSGDDAFAIGTIRVVAADAKLCHKQQVSLFFPALTFGMVLLNDGRVVEWYGSERQYQMALVRAAKSQSERTIGSFFRDADNRTRVKQRIEIEDGSQQEPLRRDNRETAVPMHFLDVQ